MRNLLFVLLLLLVIVVGVGFYQGWFSFSTSSDPDTGRVGGQLSIDKEKMKSDLEKAKQKLTKPTDQAREQADGN
jgi:hypothetical protein